MLTIPGYDPSAQDLAVKAAGYPGGMISDSPQQPHPEKENNFFIWPLQKTWSLQQSWQQDEVDTDQ